MQYRLKIVFVDSQELILETTEKHGFSDDLELFEVTTADEIEPRWLKQAETVGVSAGASTPDNIINDVLTKIKEIGKVPEEMIYG